MRSCDAVTASDCDQYVSALKSRRVARNLIVHMAFSVHFSRAKVSLCWHHSLAFSSLGRNMDERIAPLIHYRCVCWCWLLIFDVLNSRFMPWLTSNISVIFSLQATMQVLSLNLNLNLNIYPARTQIGSCRGTHAIISKSFFPCIPSSNWFFPERDYVTFGTLLSQYRMSVVCLSSVGLNVGAPYSEGWTFRQNVFTAVYAGHPLTSVQNFTEIVLGEPLRRGR